MSARRLRRLGAEFVSYGGHTSCVCPRPQCGSRRSSSTRAPACAASPRGWPGPRCARRLLAVAGLAAPPCALRYTAIFPAIWSWAGQQAPRTRWATCPRHSRLPTRQARRRPPVPPRHAGASARRVDHRRPHPKERLANPRSRLKVATAPVA